MAPMIPENEKPPKVWQPWYIKANNEESQDVSHSNELRMKYNNMDARNSSISTPMEYYDARQPLDLSCPDAPIDMSMKKKKISNYPKLYSPPVKLPRSPLRPEDYIPVEYTNRPSVIIPPKPVYSDPSVQLPPPPYSTATSRIRKPHSEIEPPKWAGHNPDMEIRYSSDSPRTSSQGGADPEIDEHFRRSLGKDYHQYFITDDSDTVDSVDDHFAKALGDDTWKKLKAGDKSPSSLSPSQATRPPPPYADIRRKYS